MSIIVLKLPDVKTEPDGRPEKCPSCGYDILQRWGGQEKQLRDPHVKQVVVYRYHCYRCRHTFRHYPEGVDQAQQSQRLRKLAAVCWALGLSYRGIEVIFTAIGFGIDHMTAWRDVQAQAEYLRQQRKHKPVRVLGLDGAYVRGWGETQPVLVAVDLGSGEPVAVGYVDEYNPQAVRRWLEPLVKQLGVSVIVTDDLVHYKTAFEKMDVEHQICQFHVRRWVGRTLKELRETVPEEWRTVVDEVKQIISELPPEGSKRLLELWKQIPDRRVGRDQPLSPVDQLRYLLVRLSEHWPNYRIFTWQNDVPWTNNGTEQVIGRMKVRSRTVRGYKSRNGLLAGLLVAACRTA
jgi:transposase-like protein